MYLLCYPFLYKLFYTLLRYIITLNIIKKFCIYIFRLFRGILKASL